jgi:hypothetical protein
MGNVVAIASRRRKPPTPVETSPEFEEAYLAYPESGRLRSSRKESWPEWCAVAAEIGEPDLVARVKRYAKEDREHRKDHGAPAFHRWLKWGRWEHWAPAPPRLIETPIFSDPVLRASFHDRFADPNARAWFDKAKLDGRWITCLPAKAEWVNGPFRKWAVENDIEGVKFS